MLKALAAGLALMLAAAHLPAAETTPPRVVLDTSLGRIELELAAEQAPLTVANFLAYVDQGHYDGTQFHRVIPGFMIQGGGFDDQLQPRATVAPIRNESDNGLSNLRGTIAMARTRDPDSATTQFFINTVDNRHLDGLPGRPGYAVFGRVVDGMAVVDAISRVPTRRQGPFRDLPTTPVLILKAHRLHDARTP